MHFDIIINCMNCHYCEVFKCNKSQFIWYFYNFLSTLSAISSLKMSCHHRSRKFFLIKCWEWTRESINNAALSININYLLYPLVIPSSFIPCSVHYQSWAFFFGLWMCQKRVQFTRARGRNLRLICPHINHFFLT